MFSFEGDGRKVENIAFPFICLCLCPFEAVRLLGILSLDVALPGKSSLKKKRQRMKSRRCVSYFATTTSAAPSRFVFSSSSFGRVPSLPRLNSRWNKSRFSYGNGQLRSSKPAKRDVQTSKQDPPNAKVSESQRQWDDTRANIRDEVFAKMYAGDPNVKVRAKIPLWFMVFPLITFGLGTWQIARRTWKKSILEKRDKRVSAPPVPLPDNIG